MLHHGDCLEVMAGMEPESVDAVVTDPPYGLGFMGKAWDHGAPGVPFWAEMLRVAKPSAYLLAFGGTRTVHRMTVALEDAGWIIRDLLSWNYASGFPKSKASLKPAWEPIIWARKPFRVPLESWGEVHHALAALIWLVEGAPQGDGCASMRVARLFDGNDRTATSASRAVASTSSSIALSWGGILAASLGDGSRFTTSTATRLTTALRTLSSCLSPVTSAITMPRCACLVDGSSSPASIAASGSSAEHTSTLDTLRRSVPETAIGPLAQSVAAVCASLAADLSDDLGVDVTALGSATTEVGERAELRPIVMARKPGPLRMLAIDACRIPGGSRPLIESKSEASLNAYGDGLNGSRNAGTTDAARWPANVILTDEIFDGGWDGVVGGGETASGKMLPTVPNATRAVYGQDAAAGYTTMETYGDSGTYSRFFLIPKADRADREPVLGGLPVDRDMNGSPVRNARCGKCGLVKFAAIHCVCAQPEWGPSSTGRANHHPTVKPVDLMRHLVRLVTPTGGTVLDPFGGSGSTALAAEMEGFPWILIEKELEYVRICEARLNGTQRGLGLPA